MNNSVLGGISSDILKQQQQQGQDAVAAGSDAILNSGSPYQPSAVVPTASPAATTPQADAPQTPQDTGNWFTHLFPTIGSVLGGIGGSVIPGFGVIGGVAGASGGSALGKAIENLAEGNSNITKDVGSSAIEGGIGQVAGGVLGKIGGGLLKTAGKAAETGATKMVQGQVAKGTLASADADYLAKSGVTNLAQHKDIFPLISGSEGAFSNGVRNSLSNAADSGMRMDFTGLKSAADDAITTAGISGDAAAVKSVQKFIDGELNRVTPGGVTKVAGPKATVDTFENGALQQIHPNDALDVANNLYNTGDKWLKSSSPTLQGQGKALQNLSYHITDNLYGPETAIGKMGISDTVRQQVLDDLAPLKEINPQYYATKVDELNSANTLGDLRSAQAVDVRANKALGATEAMTDRMGGLTTAEAINNIVPVGAAATGGAKGVGAAVASKVIQSPAANAAGAGVLGKISDLLSNPGMKSIVEKASLVPSQAVTHAPTDFTQAAGSGQALAVPTGLEGSNIMQNPSALSSIMGNNSILGQVAKMELSAMMNPFSGVHGMDQAGMDSIKSLQGNASIEAQLPELIQAYNAAGGAQGPVGGILQQLGGLVGGGPAAAYQKRADALRQEYLANTGQNLAMPTLGMNKQSADSTLSQLVQAMSVNR